MPNQEVFSQKEEINTLLAGERCLLVILDSCRWDSFAKVNWLPGELRKAVSAGSTTTEWARNTFEEYYPNTIYISSVPYISSKYLPKIHQQYDASKHFFLIDNVWDWGYDDDAFTVLPETVIKAVLAAHKSYPQRNIIAHFMQPHSPMIGSSPFTIATWEKETGQKMGGRFPKYEDVWNHGMGDKLIEAYEGNLSLVLTAVEKLASFWPDKIVITADHGEGFGESGVFGHREGIRIPELLEVPFFEVKGGDAQCRRVMTPSNVSKWV